jgi:hypothetical protein
MSARDVWENRPVSFRTLTIREGEPMIDTIAAGEARAGRYALLVATMQWADTNELVFASLDDIYAQPLRHWLVLQRLAAKAAYANGLQDADPDAPLVSGNGHDAGAAALPSP